MKITLTPFLILLVLVLGSCKTDKKTETPQEGQTEFEKPNIVMIFSDELQFSDIGYFGGQTPTPHIDSLIRSGMLFTDAYTPETMCTPSRYSILTGTYAGKCKAPEFLEKHPIDQPYTVALNTYLDSTVVTLPRLLSQNGYFTGITGKWHLGGETFDESSLDPKADIKDALVNKNLKAYQENILSEVKKAGGFDYAQSIQYGNFDVFPVKSLHYHNFPWITKGAIDFIEEGAKSDKPFFLYMTPTSLHGPHHAAGLERDYNYTPGGYVEGLNEFAPNTEQIAKTIEKLTSPQKHRASGMLFLDHQIGLVINKIRALGIEDNTMILFMPDHNTEPAKATTYEKALKIPLAIKWPKRIKKNSTNNATIQTVDLLPTILNLAQIKTEIPASVDGIDVGEIIDEPKAQVRNEVFSESGYTRAIRKDGFKYIALRYPKPLLEGMQNGTIKKAPNYLNMENQGQSIIAATFYPHYFDADQLYDLKNDPYEQNNLAYDPKYKDKVVQLKSALQKYLDRFQHPFDLEDTTFLRSDSFQKLVEETLKLKPTDIDWYNRDWGEIVWPPKNGK